MSFGVQEKMLEKIAVPVFRCFGVPVFRGLVMSVFFVGVGAMMPTVENWPVKRSRLPF